MGSQAATSLTTHPAGRSELRGLLAAADVVIEASRPRALEQLGVGPAVIQAEQPALTWVAITGYGRTGPWCNRIAFGDDGAAAAGLVACDESGDPVFCGDAIADPITGLYAAAGALAGLAGGGGFTVDVSLREAAAHVASTPAPLPATAVTPAAAPPRARTPSGSAPAFGEDTDRVLRELGIRR